MNLKGMFATKPIAAYHKEAADKTLVRALGIPSLITFGIGGIIGTGIFVLTGLAAAQHAGPAIVISFIIAGIGCMFAGLCYSEFATMVPVAGSAYAYSYATLGEFVAWFVGWNLILEYMMACSTVAVGWSRYFVKLLDHFGINFIPDWLSSAPFEAAEVGFQVHRTSAYLNLPAIAIIAAATALCYKGIKESAWVNTIIVAIKVGIVIAVIAFGAVYVNTRELGALHTEEHRQLRRVRLERNSSGLGHHFLRLYRLRRRLDRGAGSEEPAARHADRHAREPRHLYGALHPHVERHDGPGALQAAERRRAGGGRPGVAPATVLAVELGHLGCAVRTDLGDHHHDHSAGAHLADDVA